MSILPAGFTTCSFCQCFLFLKGAPPAGADEGHKRLGAHRPPASGSFQLAFLFSEGIFLFYKISSFKPGTLGNVETHTKMGKRE